MYSDKLTIHETCSRHRTFRPSAGRGAVKGGCQQCDLLVDIQDAVIALKRDYGNRPALDKFHASVKALRDAQGLGDGAV